MIKSTHPCGAVAQLGERIVRNDEAAGSIPASSTKDLPLRSVNLPCVEFSLHLSLKINQTPQPGFASNP
jgi:hypothetical protein